ncbi:MAG TPA: hypothetical protein VIY51_13300 [Xanthobacteraceae bacterium]
MSWWPGWNSIEGAAKWGDIFFWAGFALLVLLAGCEVLSKVYSWRKDTLVAMRDEMAALAQDVRSQQAEQERAEAVRIEAEHAQAQARHDAEIAAAHATEMPAAKAEAPQQRPQTLPAGRESEPVARTNEQVARLQERSPRGLTEAQKKAMIGVLAPFRGQKFSVVCIAGDPEGKNIGEQIVSVLRAAGWDFGEGGVAEATYSKEPAGVSLMVNAGQIMTPSVLRPVAMMVKAFADAGLMQRNGALADPNIPRDRIEVRIGRNRSPS